METPLKFLILLGTVRQGRESEKVVKLLLEKFSVREGIEVKLIDPRDLYLPNDDEGTDLREKNSDYQKAAEEADGFVIVTPEYNHGYPGSLKKMLDVLYEEYAGKVAGLVGVSSGEIGGARVIEGLLPVLRGLGLSVIKNDLKFFNVKDVFDESGVLKEEKYLKYIERFFDELVRMAGTLKKGR